MQIETEHTLTRSQLEAKREPLELCYHPLGKLELVSTTIRALCDDVLGVFNEDNIISVGEIIEDATRELWSITEVAIKQVDALTLELEEAKEALKAYQTEKEAGK